MALSLRSLGTVCWSLHPRDCACKAGVIREAVSSRQTVLESSGLENTVFYDPKRQGLSLANGICRVQKIRGVPSDSL